MYPILDFKDFSAGTHEYVYQKILFQCPEVINTNLKTSTNI